MKRKKRRRKKLGSVGMAGKKGELGEQNRSKGGRKKQWEGTAFLLPCEEKMGHWREKSLAPRTWHFHKAADRTEPEGGSKVGCKRVKREERRYGKGGGGGSRGIRFGSEKSKSQKQTLRLRKRRYKGRKKARFQVN